MEARKDSKDNKIKGNQYPFQYIRRTVLSFAKSGQSYNEYCKSRNLLICPATLRRWISKLAKGEPVGMKLEIKREPADENLEKPLQAWVLQAKSKRHRITDAKIKEQALLIAAAAGIKGFKASQGWIDAFKKRNKLRGPYRSTWRKGYSVQSEL